MPVTPKPQTSPPAPISANTSAISVLGFDFGTRRIGVAVGQTITGTATPLTTLPADNAGQPNWSAIQTLLQQWQPQLLVVGLPLHRDGSDSEMTQKVRMFAQKLAQKTGLEVVLQDERLSSNEAESIRQRDKNLNQQHSIDALAATIIVQDWLSNRSRSL